MSGKATDERKEAKAKKHAADYATRADANDYAEEFANDDECPDMSEDPKYKDRKGPPRPANEAGCQGKVAVGNDGILYRSQPNANGVHRWVKINKNKQ